jgi:hypothetical protein
MAAPKTSVRGPIMGVTAAGLILLGVWLSQYLPGTGFVKDENFDPSAVQVNTVAPKTSSGSSTSEAPKTETPTPGTETPTESTTGNMHQVAEVLIDEKSYFLKKNNEWQPATIPEIETAAKAAQADNTGVKVKIYRKATSMTSTEEALKTDLLKQGLPETSMYWVPDLVP